MLLARYTNWNRPCSALWRRLRLQRVKMRNDAINMEVNDGLLAFGAEEEGAVVVIVHEEVFGEDGGAAGEAEEVEVGHYLGTIYEKPPQTTLRGISVEHRRIELHYFKTITGTSGRHTFSKPMAPENEGAISLLSEAGNTSSFTFVLSRFTP